MTEPLEDLALGVLVKIVRAGADEYASIEDVPTEGVWVLTLDLHADLDAGEAALLRGLLEQARQARDEEYAERQARLAAEWDPHAPYPGIPRPTTWKPGELTPDVDPNPPRLAFPGPDGH